MVVHLFLPVSYTLQPFSYVLLKSLLRLDLFMLLCSVVGTIFEGTGYWFLWIVNSTVSFDFVWKRKVSLLLL